MKLSTLSHELDFLNKADIYCKYYIMAFFQAYVGPPSILSLRKSFTGVVSRDVCRSDLAITELVAAVVLEATQSSSIDSQPVLSSPPSPSSSPSSESDSLSSASTRINLSLTSPSVGATLLENALLTAALVLLQSVKTKTQWL